MEIRGHEFHYSKVLELQRHRGMTWCSACSAETASWAAVTAPGDKNTLATYTHTHALGTPAWAEAVVRMARSYRKSTRQREETN